MLKKIVKIIKGVVLTLIIGLLLVVGVVGYNVYPELQDAKRISSEKLMSINANTFRGLEDTRIYDTKGEILAEINIGNYTPVNVGSLSKWVTKGYIAVEDRAFETHKGINYKAICRAALEMVKNKGEITQGGSTITQQVIKNNLLTKEKSFKRKFIEFFLAPELEKEYNKAEIMNFYINTNSYGNNCEGLGSAAKYYFAKDAKDLSIAESALLVGVSNNPTKYNPKTHPKASKEKRDFVLGVMLSQGVITQEEYLKAKAESLNLKLERETREKETYLVSFAIHSAVLELMEHDGFEFKYTFENKEEYTVYKEKALELYTTKAQEVRGGGYKIYTTLDKEKQSSVQSILDTKLLKYKERTPEGKYALQGAITVVNTETGFVECIIGGRGTEDEFNRGYLAARQPGSAIKPLIVYGVAYDTGRYHPATERVDAYESTGPKNWDSKYMGSVSLREAMGRSINTVAQNVFEEVGSEVGVDYLGKMHFRSLSYLDRTNSAMALGGFTYGATTVDMAKGYSTIANYGEYTDALCIKSIEYQNMGAIYSGEVQKTQVYEPDAAYMTIDTLKSTMTAPYGLGRGLQVKGVVTGGKSGTTNAQKDVWYCGISKYYSVAVWCGYDTPKPTGMYGSGVTGEIWQEVMKELHQGKPHKDFERPSTITDHAVNSQGHYVKYNSGRTDLYSQVLQDKAERQRQEELKRKREQAEKRKVSKLQEEVTDLGVLELQDEQDISYVEGQIQDIRDQITLLVSKTDREDLEKKVDKCAQEVQLKIAPLREELEREAQERHLERQSNLVLWVEGKVAKMRQLKITTEADLDYMRQLERETYGLLEELEDTELVETLNQSLTSVQDKQALAIKGVESKIWQRKEKERLERIAQEKLEAERLEVERLEAERLETERLETERLETESVEKESPDQEQLKLEDEEDLGDVVAVIGEPPRD